MTEVLRHRAGLHIEQPGARGGRASVYGRGLDPNHTLILLDGVPLNDESNARGGSLDFSTLGVLGLERVEIIRGPVSALHGSAAMAGAINLIPRRGERLTRARVSGSGGRFGYARGRASLSGRRGPVDLALAGAWSDEGDPSSIGNYRGGEVLSHLGIAVGGDAELRGTFRHANGRSTAFPDFSGGPRLAIARRREQRRIDESAGGLRFEHALGERLSYSAHIGAQQRREQRNAPAVLSANDAAIPAVPGEPDTRERYLRYSINATTTVALTDDLDLSVGGGAYREDGRSRGDLDFGLPLPNGADFDLDRIIGSAATELFWTTPFGLRLQAGLRVELPEGRSEELLPRVGASYTLERTATTFQATWGRGFKMPSFFALASPIAGNRDLRPERNRGLDASIVQGLFDERISLRLTYFDIDVAGLIDFDAQTFTLRNLADTDSRGAELSAGATLSDELHLRLHTTYLNATGRAVGAARSSRLRNRPRWRGGFAVTWTPLPTVSANLNALFVGDVLDTAAPVNLPDNTPARVPGYHRIDTALSWQPTDRWRIFVAIDNLSDSNYEEAIGFPAVGIRPRAGVELSL